MVEKNVSLTLDDLKPRSLKHLSYYLQGLICGRLWLQVLLGMVLGVSIGIIIGPSVGWVNPVTASIVSDWLAWRLI